MARAMGEIAAIVLAAGRSSRMGTHKLLLPLGGQPVVTYAARAAMDSAAEPVLVVLGHQADDVRAALPTGRRQTLMNRDYAAGMSTSLRAGIAAVPPECTGAVVLLADQPLVTPGIIDRVLDIARESARPIVVASFAGARGTPVYFARSLFSELMGVRGDEGGRSVLARHPDEVMVVEFSDAAPALDVDDPEQYARLLAEWDRYASGSAGWA